MPLDFWVLAIGAFGVGTTEFADLLPVITTNFNVTIPAGYLATSSLAVFVGAPALIILGSKVPRKAMLVFLMLFVHGR